MLSGEGKESGFSTSVKIDFPQRIYILRFIFYFCTMKPTQHYLDKLTSIVHETEYTLRYERGTFQSGWCLLESKRIIVLNKFLDIEGRINTLTDLIPQLPVDFDKLTLESQKLYETITKTANQKAE